MSNSAWDPEGLAVDLDAQGQLREPTAAAGIDLRALYKRLVAARTFDLRLSRLGLPAWAPSAGEEAPLVAVGDALRPGDWLYPTARDRTIALGRGVTVSDLAEHILGLSAGDPLAANGIADPSDRLGLGALIATGHARALAGSGSVVATTFGEGTTTSGAFAEAIAIAVQVDAPLVLLCKSPTWPDDAPAEAGLLGDSVAERVGASGCWIRRCDGADPLSTSRAVANAFARARGGEGPAFVECVTSPQHLGPPSHRDPIERLRRRLDIDGVWTQTFQDVIEAEVRGQLERVVTRWSKEASA